MTEISVNQPSKTMSGSEFVNLQRYLAELKASMDDKLGLALKDEARAAAYLDFGCADGELLSRMHIARPEVVLAGCDIEPAMIEQAQINHPEIYTSTNPLDSINHLHQHVSPTDEYAVILSSVIHEVLSRSTGETVREFWRMVSSFDVVIIRDMAHNTESELPPDTLHAHAVMASHPEWMIRSFEARHGRITASRKNLAHFMLKARYPDDWERELEEDYMALNVDDIQRYLPDHQTHLHSHITLPFLEQESIRKYGHSSPCATHLKLILRKRPWLDLTTPTNSNQILKPTPSISTSELTTQEER